MLRSMHLIVSAQDAAFEPEGGAYGAGHGGKGHSHAAKPVKDKGGFRPWAPELMPDEPAEGGNHDHEHGHSH